MKGARDSLREDVVVVVYNSRRVVQIVWFISSHDIIVVSGKIGCVIADVTNTQ